MNRSLRDLGEAGAIALMASLVRTTPLPAGWVGIGDDAAVADLPAGTRVLTTSDVLVEDIHFRRGTIAPEDLGWKSLAVNVSDIHAMGGGPAWSIVGVSLPGELPVRWVEGLFRGMADAAAVYGAPIIGGDTVGSTGPVVVSVTVVGRTVRPRLRSHSRPGDRLVASGPHGLSRAGLWALEHPGEPLPADLRRLAERAHTRPVLPGPPAELSGLPRFALIDDSDGLGTSCRLLAEASGVAVQLEAALLTPAPAVGAIAARAGVDALGWQLWGGEDYGLVASVPPDAPLPAGYAVVGAVTEGTGVWLHAAGRPPERLAGEPFTHFGAG